MSRQSIILASLAVVGALTLSGCTASAEAAPTESTASAESTESAASAGSTTDAMSCSGFNDTATIIVNADAGVRDGRMAAQEQQGWYRLATRVLDGVPIRGEGAVSDALAGLKTIAPSVTLGAMSTTGIGSAEWYTGQDALSAACADAGSELAVESFTGG
ncbi:hypothetical protein [Cryobacterium arcticum]|nr:hypothetical protein [Cryobacterium arcticum]